MAQWKKIVVSGSRADLQQLNVSGNQQISSSAADTFLSGSFSGSFQGDGSKLTGLSAILAVSSSNGSGSFNLASASLDFSGSANQLTTAYTTASVSQSVMTFSLAEDVKISGSLSFMSDSGSVSASVFNATNELTVGVEGSSDTGSFHQVISSSYADTVLSGSFSGSFYGDGSNLTGLGGNLAISSSDGTGSINLLSQSLEIKGAASQISASIVEDLTGSGSAQVILALTHDVKVSGSLTVGGDFIVNGSSSIINTENLLIEDQFALFASGSTGPTDGGIIVNQNVTGSGKAFGFDSSANRWVLQSDLTGSTATELTPDSFVVSAQIATSASVAELIQSGTLNLTGSIYGGITGSGAGNLLITEDDIFIWA